MGYCAGGSGDVGIKENIPDDVYQKLEEVFIVSPYTDIKKQPAICLWAEGKYCEDLVIDALDALIPYITDGSVEFHGEDETFWRFRFIPDELRWEEEGGYLCFSMKEAEESFRNYAKIEKLRSGTAVCGSCGEVVKERYKYCPNCGKALKGEDDV